MFFSALLGRENFFLEGQPSNKSHPNYHTTQLISDEIWVTRVGMYAIGGTAIALFGLLCNSVSVVVLAHFRQKSSIPFLLICLEIIDSVLLFSEMCLETLTTLSQAGLVSDSYRLFIRPIYVIFYPLPAIAQTATTIMTVLITVERYIAVAKPLLALTLCSKTWARRAVFGVCSWAVVYHVPLYMAYTYEYRFDPLSNASKVVFNRTSFGESHFYNYWFVVWINFICEFLIPFFFIVVFNVLMIKALRASHSFTPCSVAVSAVSKRSVRDVRLTAMVIAVTIIFFFCELFPAVALILVRGKDNYAECSVGCNNFLSIADFMVLINSAVNFLVYCAIGKQFREFFLKLFLNKRMCRQGYKSKQLSENTTTSTIPHATTIVSANGHHSPMTSGLHVFHYEIQCGRKRKASCEPFTHV